jgi:hypothetical protein
LAVGRKRPASESGPYNGMKPQDPTCYIGLWGNRENRKQKKV